jgi:regulator of RNase E activity RraA
LRTEPWVGAADVSDVSEGHVEMDSGVQAVWEGARVAGPAFTVSIPRGDHRGVFRAIEAAEPGAVLVVDAGGGNDRCVFGAVTATAARERGIAGASIDGVIRDRDAIRELGFPVFARGWTPQAPRPQSEGRLREDVVVGGILVRHGDYIVADGDGVVRIPGEETEPALRRACALVEQERQIIAQLERGSKLSDFSNQLKRLNEGQLQ